MTADALERRARRLKKKRERFFARRDAGAIEAIHPVSGKVIKVNYQKDAAIGDLDEDLRRLPGLLAWYTRLRDVAKDVVTEARHDEHNTKEDLSLEIRKEVEEEGSSIKETELRIRVTADPRMRAAFRRRMDAEAMLRRLESAVAAIIEKKWSLRGMVELRRSRATEFHTDDSV